jgi:hypothetical protein
MSLNITPAAESPPASTGRMIGKTYGATHRILTRWGNPTKARSAATCAEIRMVIYEREINAYCCRCFPQKDVKPRRALIRAALTTRSSGSPLHCEPPSAAPRYVDSAQLGRSAKY